jgi:hypothetical protein
MSPPLNPFDETIVQLGKSLLDLLLIMRGKSHGIFMGTHQAAIFEAQGGQIGAGGFSHLSDLRATAAAIQTRQDAFNLALNRLQGMMPQIGPRVREICQPVLRLSNEYLKAAGETEQVAAELQQSDPKRFEGVILGEGGMGPEIGRTVPSLVTNQLNKMSGQLIDRGIEPRLIPSARASLQQPWTAATRELPVVDTNEVRDAITKLRDAIGKMRELVSAALARALLAGRAALAAALTALDGALVSIGSRLTSGFGIAPLEEIERIFGLRQPDDA